MEIFENQYLKKKACKKLPKIIISPFIDMKPNNYILKHYFQFKEFEFFLWKKDAFNCVGIWAQVSLEKFRTQPINLKLFSIILYQRNNLKNCWILSTSSFETMSSLKRSRRPTCASMQDASVTYAPRRSRSTGAATRTVTA